MTVVLNGVRQVFVPVSDTDRAEAFYENALGLRKLFRFGDMVHFDCEGLRLYLDKASGPEQLKAASILYFRVADIVTTRAALEARGVVFRDQPHRVAPMEDHDLWATFFTDPDEHLHALMMEAPKGWAP